MQHDLTAYLMQITRKSLSPGEAAIIPELMHCTNDAEKIADYAENVIKEAARIKSDSRPLTGKAARKLAVLYRRLDKMALMVQDAFAHPGTGGDRKALEFGKRIRKEADEVEKAHISSLKRGDYGITAGVADIAFVDIIRKLSGL